MMHWVEERDTINPFLCHCRTAHFYFTVKNKKVDIIYRWISRLQSQCIAEYANTISLSVIEGKSNENFIFQVTLAANLQMALYGLLIPKYTRIYIKLTNVLKSSIIQ